MEFLQDIFNDGKVKADIQIGLTPATYLNLGATIVGSMIVGSIAIMFIRSFK